MSSSYSYKSSTPPVVAERERSSGKVEACMETFEVLLVECETIDGGVDGGLRECGMADIERKESARD